MTRHLPCELARELLSCRLDGELSDPVGPGDPGPDDLDRHLDQCRACATWLARVERIHRAVRVRPAEVMPDLSRPVVAALVREQLVDVSPGPRRPARRHAAPGAPAARTVVLALVAVQVTLALGHIVAGLRHAGHAASDQGAFELAVAVTIGWATIRPDAARAVAVLAVPLAGCLLVTAVVGMARGLTAPDLELHHVLPLSTAALVVALGRREGSGRRVPA